MQYPHYLKPVNFDQNNNKNNRNNEDKILNYTSNALLSLALITSSNTDFTRYCEEIEHHYLNPVIIMPHNAHCYNEECLYTPTHKHLHKPNTYACSRHRNERFIYKTHIKCRELGCYKTNRYIPNVEYYCPDHLKK